MASAGDTKLLVGVERLDYTKGIVDRFRAFEQLFVRHPEWIGKLVFVQVAAPSRGTLPAYRHLHDEWLAFVENFNTRFGDKDCWLATGHDISPTGIPAFTVRCVQPYPCLNETKSLATIKP